MFRFRVVYGVEKISVSAEVKIVGKTAYLVVFGKNDN